MAAPRSARWSARLLTAGAVFVLLSGIVGVLNSAVVNGANFAQHFNDIRRDPDVTTQIGKAIAAAAIDAQPDLVAVRPALEGGAAAIVGSSAFDGVFTAAVRSFHSALTQQGSDSAVLTLADLGATVTTAVQRFLPDAARYLPRDVNVRLAEVGGQEGLAARVIPLIRLVSTLAWSLPVVAVGLIGAGIWVAPRRRRAFVRLGWLLAITGAALGVIVVAVAVAAAVMDEGTLRGAVLAAALSEFSEPLLVRSVAAIVAGGLTVAAAGALLPQVDVARQLRSGATLALRRPAHPAWALVRALGLIAVGVAIVLFPVLSAQITAVVGGLLVVFVGVSELDVVAERARSGDLAATARLAPGRAETAAVAGGPAQPPPGDSPDEPPARLRRPRAAWAIPTIGVLGLAVVVALLAPAHLPQGDPPPMGASPGTGCNGHEQLCDRPLNQIVLAASHNSMSVADGSGWFLAEQPKDMVASLDDGIRALLVDTWYGQATASGKAITADRSVQGAEAELRATYGAEVVASIRRTVDRIRGEPGVGPVEPYFCHTVCELGATPMLGVMKRLRAWMQAHPREVVVLVVQDAVTPDDTASTLAKAGLAELAYTHRQGAALPTLRQMIDSGDRLLVLMENTGGGARHPWLHQGFDLVQDTGYSFESEADFSCGRNRGAADSPLFAVNHWLSSFARLVSNAERVNAYPVLRRRVDDCVAQRGRAPNLIAVNWYDRGDLFRVVDELNGVAG